jgi:hypothetical protein
MELSRMSYKRREPYEKVVSSLSDNECVQGFSTLPVRVVGHRIMRYEIVISSLNAREVLTRYL